MDSNRRVGLTISACVAAAAAGVIVVAAFTKWRRNEAEGRKLESSLRDVQDVLSDCYDKIHEIENNLPFSSPSVIEGTKSMEPGFMIQNSIQGSHKPMSN